MVLPTNVVVCVGELCVFFYFSKLIVDEMLCSMCDLSAVDSAAGRFRVNIPLGCSYQKKKKDSKQQSNQYS